MNFSKKKERQNLYNYKALSYNLSWKPKRYKKELEWYIKQRYVNISLQPNMFSYLSCWRQEILTQNMVERFLEMKYSVMSGEHTILQENQFPA